MVGARTFTEVGSYHIDLDVRADETHASRLVSVDATFSRAEIAIPQVGVCARAFGGRLSGAEHLVARRVVVEEEWRRQMKTSPGGTLSPARLGDGP